MGSKTLFILLVSLIWMPHSLDRMERLGIDFPIYYRQASGIEQPGWLYPEYMEYVFEPFTLLSEREATLVFYWISVLAWILIVRKLNSWILYFLSFYPALLMLEICNVTTILAYLVLTPIGSLAAGLCKPYLFVFSAIHAVKIAMARNPKQAGRSMVEEVASSVRPFVLPFDKKGW